MLQETSRKNFFPNFDWTIFLIVLTNFWIFLYQCLVSVSNHFFPLKEVSAEFLEPMKQGVFPEPFEIPVYLVLTVIFVGIIHIVQKTNLIFLLSMLPKWLKWFLLIIFSFLFICYLGPLQNQEWNSFLTPFKIPVAYIASSAILMMILSQPSWMLNRKRRMGLYLIMFGIIAALLFEPGFPLSYFDSSFTLGPVYDMAHGKSLFKETLAPRYGFLSILLLGYMTQWFPLHFYAFPIFIWIVSMVEYFLYFYLFLKISKNLPLAIVGIFSLLTFHVFFSPWPILIYSQGTIIRWAPVALSYFLYFKIKDFNNKKYLFLIAVSSLFSIDAGIDILAAYFLSQVYVVLKQRQQLQRAIKSILLLCFFLVVTYLLLMGILHISGYAWINPYRLFAGIIQFSQWGFMAQPMPVKTFFWLIPLLYFTVITTFFRVKRPEFEDKFVMYVANVMFFQAMYYVNRSFYLNLMHVGVFFLITLFLFVGRYWQVPQNFGQRRKAYVALFCIFILVPTWYTKERMNTLLHDEYVSIKLGTAMKFLQKEQSPDAIQDLQLIQSIPDQKIVILSWNDTYLLEMTHKIALLNANPQYVINTKKEAWFAIRGVKDHCPSEIIMDKKLYTIDYQSLKFIGGFIYQPLLLSRLEKYCHTHYKVFRCSAHLCLAKSMVNSVNLPL